ncbi:MAG: hypothetical protein ACP5OG_05670 [Candidatus Nanoarchaeia archaeon]
MNKKIIFFALVILTFLFGLVSAEVYGAFNYTNISTSRAPQDLPSSVQAYAGNVSEINIFGYSTTQSWQGFYGNISGVIQLGDANNNILYNWSALSPQGEIYASTNGTGIQWENIQCFNFTATGSYSDEKGNGGETNLHGTNLSTLETSFGINFTRPDPDGVDETFNLFGTGHKKFYTNNNEFLEGQCRSTRLFDSSGAGTDGNFEEVLLYEPASASVVFATIINNDVLGFDGRHHDFEMLVLEDGHNTNTEVTNYYFYVELE